MSEAKPEAAVYMERLKELSDAGEFQGIAVLAEDWLTALAAAQQRIAELEARLNDAEQRHASLRDALAEAQVSVSRAYVHVDQDRESKAMKVLGQASRDISSALSGVASTLDHGASDGTVTVQPPRPDHSALIRRARERAAYSQRDGRYGAATIIRELIAALGGE